MTTDTEAMALLRKIANAGQVNFGDCGQLRLEIRAFLAKRDEDEDVQTVGGLLNEVQYPGSWPKAPAALAAFERIAERLRKSKRGGAKKAKQCSLAGCPIGLFVAEGSGLCLKTEYGNNDGMIDAYIVSSGERLWGPSPQNAANQRAMRVRPVDIADIEAFLE